MSKVNRPKYMIDWDDYPRVEELIERNRKAAPNLRYSKAPDLQTMLNNDITKHGPHLMIVSCFDMRVDPHEVLGVRPAEAIVIRNVAGRFRPAETNLAAMDRRFHISQLVIMHHTNCGASTLHKEDVMEHIRKHKPETNEVELQWIEGQLPVLQDRSHRALKDDLLAAKESKFLRKEIGATAVGLYFDVTTGLVERVEADPDPKSGQESKMIAKI